ncbi:Vitamin K epoxide reductase complex subunit 1-like protein 1 [Camponotus floridanus]|uniref:vitamin-K-epoxide reductase (warfarin-sensitive) n=1 Tax=Camponotus floridanus TaxID=104421 RepID=E2AVC2_CAMFO|nr:vitamin K epoxide reductase complex subunit 1 [Camponotus floridanus]EFN62618.1 Vitamin K epoxide reductase complex subunit 1-like protein 1 [Camponotus floridanus]
MSAGNCALRKNNTGILFACIVGLALSYYAYVVETKKEQDDSYKAMCDISEHISCTKVFMTEYGKGFRLMPKNSIFNIPNPIYGLIFYTQIAVLSTINNYSCSAAVVAFGILSNILSIYLAYILYVLNTICVVCICTYIVNATITFFAIKEFRKLSTGVAHKKKMK